MNSISGRPKTLEELKQSLRERLDDGRNPMKFCDKDRAAAGIEQLKSLDGEDWGSVWGSIGEDFEKEAAEKDAQGDLQAAAAAHFQSYAFYYVGRYPCPNHPKKNECARKAREQFVAASRSFDPPLERHVIPFEGQPGEGKEIVFYLRKPTGISRPPVVVCWGGVDGYKEERYTNGQAILEAGMAILALDKPGVGESPIQGAIDGERQFVPVFEWVKQQSDLDGDRMGIMGSSFGGYWVTKVAHVYREYIKAAVSWGGGVHYNFQPDWLEKSRYADSYLMDLAETRAHCFKLSSYEEYVAFVPKLSLLDQGVLDQPCAPLLLINGKKDTQVPIQDIYLLLEHGDPKSARIYPGGHMGRTPTTLPTIIQWLAHHLQAT